MPHNLLVVLLDPRACFAFGIVFFGGFVLVGEITQRRDDKKKTPNDESGDEEA